MFLGQRRDVMDYGMLLWLWLLLAPPIAILALSAKP